MLLVLIKEKKYSMIDPYLMTITCCSLKTNSKLCYSKWYSKNISVFSADLFECHTIFTEWNAIADFDILKSLQTFETL